MRIFYQNFKQSICNERVIFERTRNQRSTTSLCQQQKTGLLFLKTYPKSDEIARIGLERFQSFLFKSNFGMKKSQLIYHELRKLAGRTAAECTKFEGNARSLSQFLVEGTSKVLVIMPSIDTTLVLV